MKKKIVYISGAITGVSNYMSNFLDAEEKLIKLGYSVINPAIVMDSFPDGTDYNTYMDVSIAMLSHCDAIYMIDGYENSKGAMHELSYAKTYGIEVMVGEL